METKVIQKKETNKKEISQKDNQYKGLTIDEIYTEISNQIYQIKQTGRSNSL